MSRSPLYPEKTERLTVSIRVPIKERMVVIANRNHQSVSQLVTVILEDWLLRRGELRERESEEATA